MVRFIWALSFLCLFVAASAAPVNAEEVPKFFHIPIFYATDRNRIPTKGGEVVFGNERKYRGVCLHDLFLGVAYCNISNTEGKSYSDAMKKLGWQPSENNGEGPDGTELIEAPTYKEATAKFFDQVADKAATTPDGEVFMFVPGYMSTFDSGLRSAARFVYYSERPIILYSWPSKGKFTQYFSDEATIEWSQGHFNDLLNSVSLLAYRDPAIHSRIFAHSMGGRLVMHATPYLKNSKSVRELTVVCPDVDDGVVDHFAANYFDGKSTMLVRLYVSKRDFMLKLSQFVHGGYDRLGEETRQPLDSVLPPNAKRLVPEPQGTKACPEGLNRRLLTVDFSDVDTGTLGHRIPVEVLAGLSQQGRPGGNLKLTLITPKGQEGHGGDQANGGDKDKDGVVKVCKPGWRGTPILGTIYRYRPRLKLLRTKDWSLQ